MPDQKRCYLCNKPKPGISDYEVDGVTFRVCADCQFQHRNRETIELGRYVARQILDNISSGRDDALAYGFVDAVMREHRTRQQLLFKLILRLLSEWAECYNKGDGYFDARNEATVKASAAIMQMLRQKNMDVVPYI